MKRRTFHSNDQSSVKGILLTILFLIRGWIYDLASNDEHCAIDFALASDDDKPICRYLNNDCFSAIDLVEGSYGAYCLWFFLQEYDNEDLQTAVPAIVGLVLNRLLTDKEKALAVYIAEVYDYCLTYGDVDIYDLFTDNEVIADNGLDFDVLKPVQIVLFLLSEDPNRWFWVDRLKEIVDEIPELDKDFTF